jgi:hypothetical protein
VVCRKTNALGPAFLFLIFVLFFQGFLLFSFSLLFIFCAIEEEKESDLMSDVPVPWG